MKLKRYKKCMGLLKKIFLGLLHFSRSLVFTVANVSDHTKCISLSNQLGMAGPTLIYLNPNECNQRLSYYPFMVNLDVMEFVILLMTYLVAHVFQTKQRL